MESHSARSESGPDSAASKWSSGRSLTESQRARKREVDKIRARRTRQSALARVAELEDKLQSALADKSDARPGSRDGSDDLTECQGSVSSQAGDVQVLGSETSTLRSLDPGTTGQSCRGTDDGDSPMLSAESAHVSQLTTRRRSEDIFTRQNSYDVDPQNQLVIRLNDPSYLPPITSTFATMPSFPLGRYGDLELGSMPGLQTTEALQTCTEMLMQTQKFHEAEICLDDQTNQDALIRAVIQGWDVVEARGKLCPLWTILRSIDFLLFITTSLTTRLVMLRTIHRMFLFKLRRVRLDELPPWYRPRPTQIMFPHDEVADFFAWPGLRERLVLCKGSMLTNKFWECFTREFSFRWPYHSRQIYDLDVSTGRFSFSPLFENHLRELSMWQMRQRFFLSFPELGDDIGAAEQDCPELDTEPSAIQMPPQNEELCEPAVDIGAGWLRQDFAPDLLPQDVPENMSGPSAGEAAFNLPSLSSMDTPAPVLCMDTFDYYYHAS